MSTESNTATVRAQVLAALAAGATISSAAKSFSLSRQTIYNWLDTVPFAVELRAASAEYAQSVRDELQHQTADAIRTLGEVMRDPNAPAQLRVKVALAILNRPHDPEKTWHTPVPLRPDPVQAAVDVIGRFEPETAPELDKIGQKNDVQCPPAPDTPPTPPIPRSAPCPCGSGEKYKRCCGRHAPPMLFSPSNLMVIPGDEPDAFISSAHSLFRSWPSGSSVQTMEPGHWYENVGVVSDFNPGVSPGMDGSKPTLYHAVAAGSCSQSTCRFREWGAPAAFTGRLREIAATVDPDLHLRNFRSMADASLSDQWIWRMLAGVMVGLTLSVLMLSAADIYALMSLTVSRRRKEIGIRVALGTVGFLAALGPARQQPADQPTEALPEQ